MSTFGHKLKFDEQGFAKCPESEERYQLQNGKVINLGKS
jgi:UDP-2-acetamido-3-amino-2,3-dideoxy-glucuronate N-acetyltransferase